MRKEPVNAFCGWELNTNSQRMQCWSPSGGDPSNVFMERNWNIFVASQGSELLRRNKSTLSTCAGAGSQLLTQQQSEKMSGVEDIFHCFLSALDEWGTYQESAGNAGDSSLSSTFHCKHSTHSLAGKISWWKQKVLTVGLIFLSLKVAGGFQGKLFNGFLFPKTTLCK